MMQVRLVNVSLSIFYWRKSEFCNLEARVEEGRVEECSKVAQPQSPPSNICVCSCQCLEVAQPHSSSWTMCVLMSLLGGGTATIPALKRVWVRSCQWLEVVQPLSPPCNLCEWSCQCLKVAQPQSPPWNVCVYSCQYLEVEEGEDLLGTIKESAASFLTEVASRTKSKCLFLIAILLFMYPFLISPSLSTIPSFSSNQFSVLLK